MNIPGELVKLADGSYGTCDYECSDEACGNCGHSWICHHEHERETVEDPAAIPEGECSECSCTEFTHTGRAEGDPDDD